jgi:hypothetical protein
VNTKQSAVKFWRKEKMKTTTMSTDLQTAIKAVLEEERLPRPVRSTVTKPKNRRTEPKKSAMPEHGDYKRYFTYGCRCAECRTSATEYSKSLRHKYRENQPTNLVHGKVSTYTYYGCRCELCLEAVRIRRRGYKESPEAKERRNAYKREKRRLARENKQTEVN